MQGKEISFSAFMAVIGGTAQPQPWPGIQKRGFVPNKQKGSQAKRNKRNRIAMESRRRNRN